MTTATALASPRTDQLAPGDTVWHGRDMTRIEIVSVAPRNDGRRFYSRQPGGSFVGEWGSDIVARDVLTGDELHMQAAPSLCWHRAV